MIKIGDLRIDKIMPQLKNSWLKQPFEKCLNEKIGGYKKLKKKDIKENGKIPVVDQGERLITGYTNDESNLYQGGLPVVIFGDHTRRIKYIDFDFAVGADGTKLLHPFEALSPKFFYHYLKALNLESQGYSRHYRFLKQIEVPIPHINEQNRIVAKLEKMLTKVDKCKERLVKIPTILKRFRQSVLAAACSGELTKDWRNNHNTSNENSIIDSINSERQLLYENECKIASLKKLRKPKKPREIEELNQPEDFSDVPENWIWTYLNSVCNPFRGITYGVIKLGSEVEDGIPCLRTSDVKALSIVTENVKKIAKSIADKYPRSYLKGGELLVNVRGTLGGVASVPTNLAGYNISREVALVPILLITPSQYFSYWVASTNAQNWLAGVTKGVAYTGINLEDLRQLPIALPPPNELFVIIERVENLLEFSDQIAARYLNASKYVESLTQSILAKAFHGELVSQDPNDEPASELLKCITAEREQTKTQKSKIQEAGKPYRKRKKATQASSKNYTPKNVEKTVRKEPSPVPVEKEAIARRTKRKSLEAHTRQPLPLVDLNQQTIMASYRKACRNRYEISREDLLKAVSSNLGYQRLSAKLRVKLQGDMRAAILRGIIRSNGDVIVSATRNAYDYDRDDLIKFVCSVTNKGRLYEEDAVIRDTLLHLGFQRITGRMRNAVASAIRSGIRKGIFVRQKGQIVRP